MPNPTEIKRCSAAAALQDLIHEATTGPTPTTSPRLCLEAVAAIAEYSVATAIDDLTSIASSMIFRHSKPAHD